ncbi:MAG: hypothetical protein A4E71_00108 [Smithella sp. PtaU1.Bin162]|nr:MAG: hypothetical protein A4E71_00108 [Smithella sp. PtaU1.Bin162]
MNITDQMQVLHDSLLYAIYSFDNKVELYFCENFVPEPRKYKITLIEVTHLVANNFRRGNIVLDVDIFPVDKLEDDIWAELVCGSKNSDVTFRKKLSEDINVFRLLSSYGCDLFAMFAKITFEEL